MPVVGCFRYVICVAAILTEEKLVDLSFPLLITGEGSMNDSNYSEEQAVRNLLISLGYANPTQADINEALRQSLSLENDFLAPAGDVAPRVDSGHVAGVASYLDESFDRHDDERVDGNAMHVPDAQTRDRRAVSDEIIGSRGDASRGGVVTSRAAAVSGLDVHNSSDHLSRDMIHDDSFGEKPIAPLQHTTGANNKPSSRAATKGSRSKRPAGGGRVAFDESQEQRHHVNAAEDYRHQRPFNPHAEIDASVLARIAKLQDEIRSRIIHSNEEPAGEPTEKVDLPRRPSSARERKSQPQQSRPPLMHFARNSANVIYAFTGNRQYLAGAHSTLQTHVVERRSTDPVRRGQAMRDLWKRDQFLTQKGRADERWRVRQSMLSWDGQTN